MSDDDGGGFFRDDDGDGFQSDADDVISAPPPQRRGVPRGMPPSPLEGLYDVEAAAELELVPAEEAAVQDLLWKRSDAECNHTPAH